MSINNRIGEYVQSTIGGESYRAYIPKPLPPDPPLNLSQFYHLLDKANTALGRLDAASKILPDKETFIYMYVRKEAILSSQIEGTQSTLVDLLMLELNEPTIKQVDDVIEVSCYIKALQYGINRLKDLPLSLRLLKDIHFQLMNNARGGNKCPGEFRRSQNWIGGVRLGVARFVPPPPQQLMDCLDRFEKFLHDDKIQLPSLVKAAIVHLQFETIHPFLDGNGRLGRLLITLMLYVDGILDNPILYLSLYLKTHREKYYELLQSVRIHGNWEDWIEFFLLGVIETSQQATETAQLIVRLFESDRKKIEESGRSNASALSIHTLMQKRPIFTARQIENMLEINFSTIMRNFNLLIELGIVREVTGRQRNKIFVYFEYLEMLKEGTEPL